MRNLAVRKTLSQPDGKTSDGPRRILLGWTQPKQNISQTYQTWKRKHIKDGEENCRFRMSRFEH